MTSRSQPARRVAVRTILLVAAATIALGAIGAVTYLRHAEVWLRPVPAVPRCTFASRGELKTRLFVTGTERHTTLEGETVYLNGPEDRATCCALGISSELGAAFTTAFAEIEPETRAIELLRALREHVPREAERDRDAAVAYILTSSALKALPKSPEVDAAAEEVELLHACRFDLPMACPSRPPIPKLVWLTSIPSAAGLLFLLGLGARRGAALVAGRVRARRARKKARAS